MKSNDKCNIHIPNKGDAPGFLENVLVTFTQDIFGVTLSHIFSWDISYYKFGKDWLKNVDVALYILCFIFYLLCDNRLLVVSAQLEDILG